MLKEKSNQNSYNLQELLDYHRNLINKLRICTGLPEVYRFISCACRKDMQVFSMVSPIDRWDEYKNKFNQLFLEQQHDQIIMEMTWEHLKPRLEEYYEEKINFCYLLGPCVGKKNVYAYSIKAFNTQLFRTIDTYQGNNEDKFTSMISGYIRKLSGRGPERITVAILDNLYISVCVFGLIPQYIIDFAYNNKNAYLDIKDMLKSLINKAVNFVFQSEYGFIPYIITEVDFKYNRIISLAFIKPSDVFF